MDKLAIDGGAPVRSAPFPPNYLGVTLYDESELLNVAETINGKIPFRHYGMGEPKMTLEFERIARDYFGVKYALALSSGSAALFCAIIALGIGPGDEVILPSFGWISDFYAITNAGALPVFADIDDTISLDPDDFERKITPATKAVIVVNFQGCPAKMDEIMAIAEANGIKVIEDIAQAVGAEYKGAKLGSIGHIAVASFQQNKMLCCGEGGILLTDSDEFFARAVRYHDNGAVRPVFAAQIQDKSLLADDLNFAGNQYRMNELCGAVMIAQMGKLNRIIEICRHHHKRFRDEFHDNPHFIVRWVDGDCGVSIFLLFPTAEEAMRFQECLSVEGVPVGPKSACRNLMNELQVRRKAMTHPAMPPFGKGFNGEHINYDLLGHDMKTDSIIARLVAISIGPQYSETDMDDIINAVDKVDRHLYGKSIASVWVRG